MNIKTLIVIIVCSALQINCARAQILSDTLSEAVITSKNLKDTIAEDVKLGYNTAQSNHTIDLKYLRIFATQSLSNLISNQSSVFVKSYGINSLATLSFRGASAAQSSVYWEGVPLQNPSLGMADISMLQTGVFNKISMQYGSSSALYGSGNVGGALLLSQDVATFLPNKKLSVMLSGGSFSRKAGVLQSQYQNNKIRIAVNLFYQNAQNNFTYTDYNNREHKMQNARLLAFGGLSSLDYNLSQKPSVKESVFIKLWWQKYNRQIPAALFEQTSEKQQLDRAARFLAGWQRENKQHYIYSKTAYSNELLHFEDAAILMDNLNLFHSIYHETGWQYTLSSKINATRKIKFYDGLHHFLVFTPIQYAFTDNATAISPQYQFRPAIAFAYKFKNYSERWYANAMLRKEWVNGTETPLLPGIGMSYNLLKSNSKSPTLTLKANAQKTYRIPTISELYASVGGNANLKPEQGWNIDGGYVSEWTLNNKSGNKPLQLKHELNVFNRNIKDWIYWLGGAIWTPHNVAQVHSRGLETMNKIQWQVQKNIALNMDLNYTYVLSTTIRSYIPGDGSIGKQIPYTPRYNIQTNFGITLYNFWLNYNLTYSGYRFTTTDESQYLLPYTLSNIYLSYPLKIKNINLNLSAQAANIFDIEYQVVNGRPMPGRNFIISCNVALF